MAVFQARWDGPGSTFGPASSLFYGGDMVEKLPKMLQSRDLVGDHFTADHPFFIEQRKRFLENLKRAKEFYEARIKKTEVTK